MTSSRSSIKKSKLSSEIFFTLESSELQKKISDLLDESNDEFGQFLKKYYGEYYQRKGSYGDEDYKIPDLYSYDDISLLILNDYELINTKPSSDDSS